MLMPADDNSDDYEILPQKEVEELKSEIRQMKELELSPTKKTMATMVEVAAKMDKMNAVFEEAMHELKAEEGGLSFQEKMKPLVERMNKILEQNSEIAQGIVALADLLKDLREELTTKGIIVREEAPKLPEGLPPPPPPPAQMFSPMMQQPMAPAMPVPSAMPAARPPLGAAAVPAPGMPPPPAGLPPLPRQPGLPPPPRPRPPA
jgi:hypothetical protein